MAANLHVLAPDHLKTEKSILLTQAKAREFVSIYVPCQALEWKKWTAKSLSSTHISIFYPFFIFYLLFYSIYFGLHIDCT